jgi:3'-phosphoadenosine 5'-phosphosulfate sulfotransferase (PAPS reductase)/FAD synthetase
VVNTSGGKDSQTALRRVVSECDRVGFPRERIVMAHQCLGKQEWGGTLDLVKEHAAFYGLRLEIASYRSSAHEPLSLLEYIRRRGKWPDSKNRFCTSEFKRGPGGRVLTRLSREASGPILNVFGFRSEESAARAKLEEFSRNDRFSSTKKEVWNWHPIQGWLEFEVWHDIRESGVRYHPAYDLGMPRLSCCFCIFAPRAALIIAGRANPDLLDEYVAVEREIGHDFQHGKPIERIRDAIHAGEGIDQAELRLNWNM